MSAPNFFSPSILYPRSGILKTASVLFLIFALLCAVSLPAAAQTFRGTILGTVTDPQGAVVADAKVAARNVATGLERSTVTDSEGNYTIPELPIGVYEVTIEATGFKAARITDIKVEVASERRADVQLTVSGSNTIDIRADALQVESTNNPGFNTVTPTRVQLVSLSYLKIFSPTKVNEARFGYNRFTESFFPQDSDFDPRTIGLNTGIQGA